MGAKTIIAMLTFDRVTFRYADANRPMIDQLNFTVERGEFVSMIGASGCGKSTILRLINRLLRPESGEILVNGIQISKQKNYCGYMPQHDLLFPWRTVRENIRLPLEIRGGLSQSEMQARTDQMLQMTGLDGWGDQAPSALSGGMRQRAAFARTILTGSDLLLLDEPFSALDYLTRLSMREWLLEQWQREKKTILFITHDVEEAIFLSGRIFSIEESPIMRFNTTRVPMGYPRSIQDMQDPDILALKDQMIRRLRGCTL